MAESNLVRHARRELALVREDPEVVAATMAIVEEFSNIGHSGTSAHFHREMIARLLRFENLTPLTDDPDEWILVAQDELGGLWQNVRNSKAFSRNVGSTYTLLSERPRPTWWNRLLRRKAPVHTSQRHVPVEALQ